MPVAPFIEYDVDVPDGVSAIYYNGILNIKGPKGEMQREFRHQKIDISVDDKKIKLRVSLPRKKEKALIGTWRAHIRNMITGVTEGFEYRLKAVHAHFPMQLSIKKNEFVIDNFLGERAPRKAKIIDGVKVEIKGSDIIVSGIEIEKVGQTAANIEAATKIKRRDPRVFQDGIYIVKKPRGVV